MAEQGCMQSKAEPGWGHPCGTHTVLYADVIREHSSHVAFKQVKASLPPTCAATCQPDLDSTPSFTCCCTVTVTVTVTVIVTVTRAQFRQQLRPDIRRSTRRGLWQNNTNT